MTRSAADGDDTAEGRWRVNEALAAFIATRPESDATRREVAAALAAIHRQPDRRGTILREVRLVWVELDGFPPPTRPSHPALDDAELGRDLAPLTAVERDHALYVAVDLALAALTLGPDRELARRWALIAPVLRDASHRNVVDAALSTSLPAPPILG